MAGAARPSPEFAAQVRAICLALPEVHETTQFDGTHTVFQAGKKTFLYLGAEGLGIKTEPGQREVLLSDPRFTVMRYIGQHGWVSVDLSTGPIDWDEVEDLIITSYRQAALKRMLKQLDG